MSKAERIANTAADLINQKIKEYEDNTPVFMVTSLMKANVKVGEQWRMKPVQAGQELFLKSVRKAGRGTGLIFEFEPVDAAAIDQVDFPSSKIEEAIAGIGSQIKTMFGMEDTGSDDTPLMDYLTMHAKAEINRLDEIQRREEEERKRHDAEQYSSNPNWGMF